MIRREGDRDAKIAKNHPVFRVRDLKKLNQPIEGDKIQRVTPLRFRIVNAPEADRAADG
jgi:hypothetical protein